MTKSSVLFAIFFIFFLSACANQSAEMVVESSAPESSPTPTISTPIVVSPTPSPIPTKMPIISPTPTFTEACSADEDFLIVGYLPEYREFNPSWGEYLTDFIYFSAEPLANGELDTQRLNPVTLQAMREMKEKYGMRIFISIGGMSRSAHFGEMVSKNKTRRKFVENLVQFSLENELDGVDFDWEFPRTEAEREGYVSLMQEMRGRGLIISVALYPSENLNIKPYLVADRIYIMSYERGIRHSTLSQSMDDLTAFLNGGVPAEKLFLGIPFYGRQIISPYKDFSYAEIMKDHEPHPAVNEIEDIYFNGIQSVQRKTRYTYENNFGGVMIWELGQDTFDETSLLRAIYESVNENCSVVVQNK